MNIKKFKSLPMPKQNPFEWKGFLEFASNYFLSRRIKNPIVVELGTHEGNQRVFYEEILNATYIGIDNKEEMGEQTKTTILGNTHDVKVFKYLKAILNGSPINLLFIDACHRYKYVKKDYEIYGPLTENLIAFHDIKAKAHGVRKFWAELHMNHLDSLFVSFCNAKHDCQIRMGIGVEVIK